MYLKEKVDNRVKYTREWTYLAVEKLLINQSYNDITITEIIDKAGISRATFYRNFSSKDDIIKFKVKTFFTDFYYDLISYVKLMNSNIETELIVSFFKAIHNNSSLIDTVIKSNLEYIMVDNIVEIINMQKEHFYKFIRYNGVIETYIINIVASSAWTLLSSWFKGGQVESPEELTKIYLYTFESVYIALYGDKKEHRSR